VTFTNLNKEQEQAKQPQRLSAEATALCGKFRNGTLERGETIVWQAGTGWDYRAIIEEYAAFIEKKGAPKYMDAAFLGFVKKKAAKAP
jgi:hypothetical protein